MNDYEDDRELTEVPPDEPAGTVKVAFNVPVPRIEQVAGEISRQILAAEYKSRDALMKAVRGSLDEAVDKIIAAKVVPLIEEWLTKPLRPTDAFGNPVGEPTTLQGVLAQRVTEWCHDVVDANGKPTKSDGYNSSRIAPRLNWMLGQIVHGELQKLVDVEVKRIVGELKTNATLTIAKQIAEKISSLVLK